MAVNKCSQPDAPINPAEPSPAARPRAAALPASLHVDQDNEGGHRQFSTRVIDGLRKADFQNDYGRFRAIGFPAQIWRGGLGAFARRHFC
jgi:hypothetical protein